MGYYDLLARFLSEFPHLMREVRFWSPGGDSHTIAVELASGQMYVYSYQNDENWSLTAVGGPAPRKDRSAKATRA